MMEYFHIKQDHRVSSYPQFVNSSILLDIESRQHVYCEAAKRKFKSGYIALPFMEHPAFIISKELKSLFDAYQEHSLFFPFFTKDIEGEGLPYYVFRPFILDCLSEETAFLPNKGVKKLVLNREKIGFNKVFQVGGLLGRYLIVDLEILELMLYNGIYPFVYTSVLLSRREGV